MSLVYFDFTFYFRCYFKSKSVLTIRLGRGSSLSYHGDTISLAAGAFSTRGHISTENSPLTNLSLAAIANKITPVAVISGNKVYSICDRVRIHGRGSTGDGGRGLTYIWGIEFASSVNLAGVSTNDNNGLNALKNKLSALPSRRNQIHFLASDLASSLEYKVTLKVKCFLFLFFIRIIFIRITNLKIVNSLRISLE